MAHQSEIFHSDFFPLPMNQAADRILIGAN